MKYFYLPPQMKLSKILEYFYPFKSYFHCTIERNNKWTISACTMSSFKWNKLMTSAI